MNKIVLDLTQGHLENWQAAFREKMQGVNEKWAHPVALASSLLPTGVKLAPPATHAFPFYLKFLILARERTENGKFKLATTEQRGLMVRAAIQTAWLTDAPWQAEEVPGLSGKLVSWMGKQIDETYSDFAYDVDKALVEAALEAGWFPDLTQLPLQPSEVENLARLVKLAYRNADELDPE